VEVSGFGNARSGSGLGLGNWGFVDAGDEGKGLKLTSNDEVLRICVWLKNTPLHFRASAGKNGQRTPPVRSSEKPPKVCDGM
jgi:hypothetical protein